jgi:hypothetical protein
MALIWIVPVSLTLVVCALGYRWQRMLDDEVTRLRAELQALPVLASGTRAVRLQADRTADATNTTVDVFGPHLPK